VSDEAVDIERRRYDRATGEQIERRRYPRVEPKQDVYVEDANGRTLGLVGDVSDGGFSVFPESDEQAIAFNLGKEIVLTLVAQEFRLKIHARVVYRTPFSVGLEFV
jgi:hypothetical protein